MSHGTKKEKNICNVNKNILTSPKSCTSKEDGVGGEICDQNKSVLRSNKLARRARSFKEDILEKISQIRTPTNTLGRASPSPNNHHHGKTHLNSHANNSANTSNTTDAATELNYHVRQVKNALKHFKDVISKGKFEVLPGNGTVLLESIANINNALQSLPLNVHRNSVTSAKTQLYLSLGRLIKLSDEVLTKADDGFYTSFDKDNVIEIIESVDHAIQNLVESTNVELPENATDTSDSNSSANNLLQLELSNMLKTSNFDNSSVQRTSLPDIPLTNREREIINNETTSIRTFYSTDSILSDCIPPPKPPYPARLFQSSSSASKVNTTESIVYEEKIQSVVSEHSFDYDTIDALMLSNVFNKVQMHSSSSDQDIKITGITYSNAVHNECIMSPTSIVGGITELERKVNEDGICDDQKPPMLPVKTRSNNSQRTIRSVSHYDNFRRAGEIFNAYTEHRSATVHQSSVDSDMSLQIEDYGERPPPLPVKKKYIMAYMEMFGNCSSDITQTSSNFMRHTFHSYNVNQPLSDHMLASGNNHHQKQFSQAFLDTGDLDSNAGTFVEISSVDDASDIVPPTLPPKKTRPINLSKKFEDECKISELEVPESNKLNVNTSPKRNDKLNTSPIKNFGQVRDINSLNLANEVTKEPSISKSPNTSIGQEIEITEITIIEELDIDQYLIYNNKKENEDDLDVKGGPVDALVVYATKVHKNAQNAFGEAFLITYRTFISPPDLVNKLIHRYSFFCYNMNQRAQKAVKETFSLLVRVVNTLTSLDLTQKLSEDISAFVYQLICSGDLPMAKLLRNSLLEKLILMKQQSSIPTQPILPARVVTTNVPSLLDLKSSNIAEQMTLLDAELFQKIEISEILLWAQEQCEERSPNLTRFTEHFNKMSYWARTQILKQEDAKDREKYVIKFIKIMKHLRKINNYNSYLALLSALDSAPIRRLEWHRTITVELKEYCALIDSSSSFRAYRQALAETSPPCIPYIGLVLQDLTFVYIGNQDYLSPGIVNFSKHWQQHNIVINIKRFKKCSYPFKKNARIIQFFDNFENYLDEDAMWQISENIKPRMTRRLL